MKENLVLILLVLMVVLTVIEIHMTRFTLGRNYQIASDGEKRAQKELDKSQRSIELISTMLERERGRNIAPAFLVTEEGVKVLPANWKSHFEAAWNDKP